MTEVIINMNDRLGACAVFLEDCKDELDRLSRVPNRNVLQLIHKESRENVWSDLLAFFLDATAEHRFGDAVLLNGLALNHDDVGKVLRVEREVITRSGGRIDIVIAAENAVIGIENKNHASLQNDLIDYYDHLLWMANGRIAKAFVLSAYDLSSELCASAFEYLGYKEFFSRISDSELFKMDETYGIVWRDFKHSVCLSMNGGLSVRHIKEQLDFLHSHNEAVSDILSMHRDVCCVMCNILDRLSHRKFDWQGLPSGVKVHVERRCWKNDELFKLVAVYDDGPSLSLQITLANEYRFRIHSWCSDAGSVKSYPVNRVFDYGENCEEEMASYCQDQFSKMIHDWVFAMSTRASNGLDK